MELRLLGEVELWADGQLLDVGAPRLQAVLAALAVDAGRPVAMETLIDRVWNDDPPLEVRNVLYSYLSRIRRLLNQAATLASGQPVRIERRHAGYVLDIDPELVDLHRFRNLVDRGHDPQCGDDARAATLAEALALWRGLPLAGLPGEWAARVRDRWHQRRLDAVVLWAQLELRLSNPAAVLTALPDLAAEYPLAEPLEALLMRALHAAGRGAEALDRYTAIRQRLADELGADPGPELRAVHQDILRGQRPAVVAPPTTVPAPAQLPPDTAVFTGRDTEIDHLDTLLADAEQATAVVISAVSGTAGVGKTALAVHWAHQVRDRFPDGQLYVNLRGFDPTGSPVTPAEAVRSFLEAFDVAPGSIPVSVEAQIGLYRSLLANRRVLAVLDNARDAEQVRPLLPGAPGCVALVTSRNRLTGLVADGAHPITLDLLALAEARELLARRVGTRRVAAEPRAVEEIVTRCARLPLALAIVAARAATHPHFGLTALAGELGQTRDLNPFTGTDPATDVRSVFSWSYRQLRPEAARLFQLLGLHPGPDIGTHAAAGLAGLGPQRERTLLSELANAHLLFEHLPGRYTFHDLLRAYATEQAGTLTAEQQQTARRRLVDHYLHTAFTADRLLHPHRPPIQLDPPRPDSHPQPFADEPAAWAWFAAEHRCLLAIQQLAVRHGWHRAAWQLAWTLDTFHYRRGHRQEPLATWQAGVTAAEHDGDAATIILAHRRLGHVCANVGRHADALHHIGHALTLAEETGDLTAQAHAHQALAWACGRQGADERALDHATSALNLYRVLGEPVWEAAALGAAGWYSARLGHHEQADTYLRAALTLSHRSGHREGEADTLDSLGYLSHRTGRHDQALDYYQRALTLLRDLGDTFGEADILDRLGQTHAALGNHDRACEAWRQALRLYRSQHRAEDADRVRQQLDRAPDIAANAP